MKLAEHPFIQSISADRREDILTEIELLELKRGDIIFREDSSPDALYIILEGFVAFNKEKPDGTNQHVSTSGEGSFFGEVGVFTGEQRALGASAQTNCIVGKVPEQTVKKIIEDAEPVKKVLESVIAHLKSTTSHYMEDVMRKEKLSLVGTMVSSILHDFKNPFSIISLGSYILQQKYGKEDPKAAKICANIEAQIRRMVDMANDLSAFARGEDEIELEYVSMEQLFAHFQELNAPYFQDESVTVEVHHNNVSLQGDTSKLLRVLQNLVANAIEAIHQTRKPGTITITAIDKGQTIYLSVADNGPGIPDEIQSRFFEPFITYGKSEGTGLGTAIVRSIVDAHQGHIIFSTSPTGTTFTIQLPKEAKDAINDYSIASRRS
jgi:signal transduction histidine kinase